MDESRHTYNCIRVRALSITRQSELPVYALCNGLINMKWLVVDRCDMTVRVSHMNPVEL